MSGLPKIARFTRLQSSILMQSKFKTKNWKRFGVFRMIDAFTTSFTRLPRRRMVGAPFARLIANVIVDEVVHAVFIISLDHAPLLLLLSSSHIVFLPCAIIKEALAELLFTLCHPCARRV
jgi:hypothetical protein